MSENWEKQKLINSYQESIDNLQETKWLLEQQIRESEFKKNEIDILNKQHQEKIDSLSYQIKVKKSFIEDVTKELTF